MHSKSGAGSGPARGSWRLRFGRSWRACAVALLTAAGLGLAPASVAAATTTGAAPAVSALAPVSGPPQGGTQVEIHGSGFVDVTGVLFGNTSAPFVTQSTTLIVAFAPQAPAGGGSVAVRVVSSAGTSAAATYTYVGPPGVTAVYPANGPVAGGTSVLISGTGFLGATAVDFGAGRAATFTVVSNTEIEAQLPPDTNPEQQQQCVRGHCKTVLAQVPATSALTVDVTIVTPVGSSAAVAADQFTYMPSPVVTSVAPATGPAAGGTQVTIGGSGFTGALSVSFGGVPASFQVVSDGQIEATSPPGSGTVPVQVAAGPAVRAVAVGGDTAYAILSDGSLWQWGLRAPLPAAGAATAPACDCATVPEQVSGIGPVTAVAAGTDATYALAADGTVWAWGVDGQGQLGNGRLVDSARPVRVSGLGHVVAIAAGSAGGMALESDGSVWAWGSDISGQLGSPAALRRACLCSDVPVRVRGLPSVTGIAAGALTGYALTASGAVWSWGGGGDGQLGTGSRRDVAPPEAVPGLSGVVQVAAGQSSGYALGGDGSVWAWGDDGNGQLGDLGVTPSATCSCISAPAAISGLPAQVASIAAGRQTAYALTAQGVVWAWGADADGQLGQQAGSAATGAGQSSGSSGASACLCDATPAPVAGLTNATLLAAGGNDAFAVTGAGVLDGWGNGGDGQLGPAGQAGSNASMVPLPFWSDASASGPSAAFTYVPEPATAGAS